MLQLTEIEDSMLLSHALKKCFCVLISVAVHIVARSFNKRVANLLLVQRQGRGVLGNGAAEK